jgi:hypothetical protein
MSDHPGSQAKLPETPLKRRGLLLGASVAGVGVLAAKALPVPAASPAAAVTATTEAAAAAPGGYQLSAHVLRYYETTRA